MSNRQIQWTFCVTTMLLSTGSIGCDSRDERLHQLSSESLARQAEQNEQMARQSQTTADATKQLVEANAESRAEFQRLQEELQAERTSLDRQHEMLEQDRKELASERQRDSILGPLISSSAGLLAAVLPLFVCLYLLLGMFRENPDEQLGEILVRELVAEEPLLLPPVDATVNPRLMETADPAVGTHRIGLTDVSATPHEAESKLLIVVEGQHDVGFLKQMSTILCEEDMPNLREQETVGQVVFIPTGGGDLSQWTDRFAHLNQHEFHLYDREVQPLTDERQAVVAAVNRRPGCQGVLTRKRSIENYLHPEAIREHLGVEVTFVDDDNVAESVAVATLARRGADWHHLSSRAQRKLRERAKQRLHRLVVPQMTAELLAERDPDGEVEGWLRTIATLLTD